MRSLTLAVAMATLVKQEMVPVEAGDASVVVGGGQWLFVTVV